MPFNHLIGDFLTYGVEHYDHLYIHPMTSTNIYDFSKSPILSEPVLSKARITTFYGYLHDARVIAGTKKG